MTEKIMRPIRQTEMDYWNFTIDSDREAKSAKDRADKLQSESVNNEKSTKIA